MWAVSNAIYLQVVENDKKITECVVRIAKELISSIRAYFTEMPQ
jgi:hypothetical protein